MRGNSTVSARRHLVTASFSGYRRAVSLPLGEKSMIFTASILALAAYAKKRLRR